MIFYLGIHRTNWMRSTAVPLFVSRTRLSTLKTMPRALGPWALDSGGFTELDRNHAWTLSPEEYARFVRRCVEEVGHLAWAAPQDWMCGPQMLASTGLTVRDHQRLTTENLLRLRTLDPALPIIPVLQGWHRDDYMRHIDDYEQAGIVLTDEPLVGVGSVVARQGKPDVRKLFRRLAGYGIRCHGFGVKAAGLLGEFSYADALASADSMSWSYQARKQAAHGAPSCDPAKRKTCANCLHYALEWRDKLLAELDRLHPRLYSDVPVAA